KFFGSLESQKTVGRFDQSLAWHAPPKDAKTSKFIGALNANRVHSQTCGGLSGKVPGAAASDYNEIKAAHCERKVAHLEGTFAVRRLGSGFGVWSSEFGALTSHESMTISHWFWP